MGPDQRATGAVSLALPGRISRRAPQRPSRSRSQRSCSIRSRYPVQDRHSSPFCTSPNPQRLGISTRDKWAPAPSFERIRSKFRPVIIRLASPREQWLSDPERRAEPQENCRFRAAALRERQSCRPRGRRCRGSAAVKAGPRCVRRCFDAGASTPPELASAGRRTAPPRGRCARPAREISGPLWSNSAPRACTQKRHQAGVAGRRRRSQ